MGISSFVPWMFRKDGEIGRKTFETILDSINFE